MADLATAAELAVARYPVDGGTQVWTGNGYLSIPNVALRGAFIAGWEARAETDAGAAADLIRAETWAAAMAEASTIIGRRTGTYEATIDLLAADNPYVKAAGA